MAEKKKKGFLSKLGFKSKAAREEERLAEEAAAKAAAQQRVDEKMAARTEAGETIKGKDIYFVTNPMIMTNSTTHSWINDTVFIGVMNELKMPTENEKGFVRYDIFRVVPH